MDDMKTKVDSWAESALSLNRDNPDDAIVTTITPFVGELNEEVIKRIVEAYNVRNFLDRQKKGEDMEASFPLANADLVYAKVFKDSLKDSIELEEPEDNELPDFTEPKCASLNIKTHKVVCAKIRNEYKDTLPDTLRYAVRKCAEFISKFDEFYSKNNKFIKECRYLYPNSRILKAAGLEKGPKQIPTCMTITHSEFGTIEKIMEKIGANNKNRGDGGNQPQNKGGNQPQKKNNIGNADPLYSRVKDKVKDFQKEVKDVYDITKSPFSAANTAVSDIYGATKAPLSAANTLVNDIYDNAVPNLLSILPTYDPETFQEEMHKLNPMKKLYDLIKNDDLETEYADNTQKMLDILTYKNNFESVIKNDPALAGADPRILLNVYKSTVSLAPTLMKNKEIVRSILRSANAIGTGGLDPETALTLSKIEGNISLMRNKNIQRYLAAGKENA